MTHSIKIAAHTLLAVWLATAAAHSAASGADSRCQLAVGVSHLDFGTLTRAQLQAAGGANLTPGTRSVPVSVTCSRPRAIKLAVQGERNTDGQFLHGRYGVLRVRLTGAQLDGRPVALVRISSKGTLVSQPANAVTVAPGDVVSIVEGASSPKGQRLTLALDSEPLLPDAATRVASTDSHETRVTVRIEQ
ncbi:hypothetical protein [Burkholderia pyrrocinia]|uniref:hypothetical protein n=1 Tax=Burkholderia pyrrocinia TaxID=60550 RepID=UPI001045F013|nr:hypothetical protein [Burkholderia pyrrocinia]TDA48291.1 hypothetical protein EVG18_06340 [Burkholderia pyrrocinia]